jgi:hypothetical protein
MNPDWQNPIALAVVAAAGFYLARVVWVSVAKKKAAGCGSCGACPVAAAPQDKDVFQIGSRGGPEGGTNQR